MAKWQIALVAAFIVVFGATVVLTGNPSYLIAGVLIVALVVGWALLNAAGRRRMEHRHGSLEDAMSDETDPVPGAHLIPDNETAAGDTPEAHDEINPHDLPRSHPGRRAAEREARPTPGDRGARTTRGDADPSDVDARRTERLEGTVERGG
jgi:hypothetical protein